MSDVVHGRVAAERIDVGSKSERLAIVLHTADERLVLRQAGAPSFDGSELAHLVGQTVEAHGVRHKQYFDITSAVVRDDDGKEA